ncbi:proteasome adapter and scaffold protein ECM29-like isoform X2 [Ptychodera flava]|uniref:proteasome adapter and scaffold protein ECM29-like isoform X2 n=1 Tax=Ptychodera flava TaxID=63121 RepID=UPI003969C093
MAAQDELELLERVFLRVGSAETDEQLQNVVSKFLAPVLLKLSSQQEGVRKKVMELLVHINRRIKSRPKIQLPVEPLLLQYQDPSAVTFVTNFTILYIKMGYPRMAAEKQAELAPTLIQCIEGKPAAQQDSLMQLLIPALSGYKYPPDADKRKVMFGLSERPKTVKLLLDFMLDYLFLPYTFGSTTQERPGTAAAPGPPEPPGAPGAPGTSGRSRPSSAPASTVAAAAANPTAGLSQNAVKRLLGENIPDPEQIEKNKVGILNFLGADILTEQEVICHLIVGCSDTRHSVATAADLELKRIQSGIDWNDPIIVKKMYSIFQGTVVVKGQKPQVKPEDRRSAASTRIRMKLFPFLLKSREACEQFPSSIQIVFDCLFGNNTNNKLKVNAVQFVHHLCLCCSDAKITPMAPVLMSGMLKLIGGSKDNNQLKGLGYVAVGKIARRVPSMVTKDIGMIQLFFEAMCKSEDKETRLHVQEALSMMTPALRNLEGPNVKLMEALVMSNVENNEAQARVIAVQYAVAVFPPNHIPSRYVLLLASGDVKEDIHSEAIKALRSPAKPDDRDETKEWKPFPEFTEVTNYIKEKAAQRLKSQSRHVIGTTHLPFNPSIFNEVLLYMRMCLAYAAGLPFDSNLSDPSIEQAPAIGVYVNQLLKTGKDPSKGPVQTYVEMSKQLLSASASQTAMYCLLEILAVSSRKLAVQFVDQLEWIKGLMHSSREEMRENAAQLFAVVACTLDHGALFKVVKELTKNISDQRLETQHGSLLALGYLIGRYLYRKKLDVTVTDMETDLDDTVATEQLNEAISDAVKAIVDTMDSSQALLNGGACLAIGEISRNGSLPLEDGQADNKEDAAEGTDKKKSKKDAPAPKQCTKLLVVEKLSAKIQSSKEPNKVKEKACLALGYMPVGTAQFPHTRRVIQGLLDSTKERQVHLHFSVGEALNCAALGQRSPANRDMWTEDEKQFSVSEDDTTQDDMEWLLDTILSKYTINQVPHVRQASCLWLLSLVKKSGSHPAIQSKLQQLQVAFMNMLTENDEFTQDAASKGLGLVYDHSNSESRQKLVSDLVETLTSGRKSTQTVTADTQVFQEGSLGQSPTGGSLSTYKELCSLASDLNQPDLVYKFMHLANHNAMWNSKKGAAFGFSSIMAQAGEQLAPYLPKIVPKLYRYQYDPNPQIRQSMTSIWNAVVSDNKKTVDTYLREILQDLMLNLTSNMWRIRESSCLALSDLLRGRDLDSVVEHLPELLETCFRVRDDIKESVRLAAESALKTLTRAAIKLCDVSRGSVGDQAIGLVLPVLLKCLPSKVEEVRALCLQTLVKISKNAGKLIQPHVTQLVIALLESLSGLEPQVMNYLALHVSKNQETQEKLDNARIAASKSSPMMDTVNWCVQYVDYTVLPELVPRVTDLIRNGIGVGTKAGCSNFIIMLTHQCSQDLQPYAGKLMSALLNGLSDRSPAIRKAYAVALGHIVRVAKDSSTEKLVVKLKTWYLEKEDENIRTACGLTLQAMARQAPDILKRHASTALPLAFLAMHECKTDSDSDNRQSVWEEVWLDSTPGTEGGIRLYLSEIVDITERMLGSQSWHMKAQAASAMSTVATKLASTLKPPHLGSLLKALLKGLSGRTWDGKESLLKAVQSIGVSCKEALQSPSENTEDQPSMNEVFTAVLKECKRDKIEYKIAALHCLAAVVEAQEVDKFAEISEILFPLISEKKTDNDKEDEDDDEDLTRKDRENLLNLKACAFECLGKSWPSSKETQNAYQEEFCKLLSEGLKVNTINIQSKIINSLEIFVDRLCLLDTETSLSEAEVNTLSNLFHQAVPPLCKCLGYNKYGALKLDAVHVLEKITMKLKDKGQEGVLSSTIRDEMVKALENTSSESLPKLKDQATKLQKVLSEMQ